MRRETGISIKNKTAVPLQSQKDEIGKTQKN